MNEVRIFLSNSAVLWIVSKKIARGCSLWTRLFFLIKSNLRSVVQWIITLCFTGLLKIRVFRRTRRWIYQKLLSGVKYYLWFPIDFSLVKKIYWSCVPQYTWDILCACPSWPQCEWGILLSTRWAPHIPIVTSGATWLNLQAGCTGRRRSVEYHSRSLDLTSLDFQLLRYVKEAAFLIKPKTREKLREDMEGSWAAIPIYTMFDVFQLSRPPNSGVPAC